MNVSLPVPRTRVSTIVANPFYARFLVGVLCIEFAAGFYFFSNVWELSRGTYPEWSIAIFLFPALFASVYLAPAIGAKIEEVPEGFAFVLIAGVFLAALLAVFVGNAPDDRNLYLLAIVNAVASLASVATLILRNKVIKNSFSDEDVGPATAVGQITEYIPDITTGLVAGLASSFLYHSTIAGLSTALAAIALLIAVANRATQLGNRSASSLAQAARKPNAYALSTLRKYPTLMRCGFVLFAVNTMITSVTVYLPVWAAETIPDAPWYLGMLYSIGAAAGLTGAALGPQIALFSRPDIAVVFGWVALGALLSVGFWLSSPIASAVFYFIAFAVNSACFVHMRSQLIRAVSSDEIARVTSSYRFIAQAGMPLGVVVFGSLAERVNTTDTLILTCAICGVIGMMLACVRGFREFATSARLQIR